MGGGSGNEKGEQERRQMNVRKEKKRKLRIK